MEQKTVFAFVEISNEPSLVTNFPAVVGPKTMARLWFDVGGFLQQRLVDLRQGPAHISVPIDPIHADGVRFYLTAPGTGAGKLSMLHASDHIRPESLLRPINLEIIPVNGGPVRPGSRVPVTLRVRDDQGAPVEGQIALGVVDEATFAIAEDRSAPLADFFVAEPAPNASPASRVGHGLN